MELLDHLRRLSQYNVWANNEVLASLTAIPFPPERSRKLMAHIVAAEWLWLRRLREGKQMPVWPDLSLSQCRQELGDLSSAWKKYLSSLSPLSLGEEISYTNSKGEHWSSKVGDVLTHIGIHSAYHRGQIASDVRQSGNTPAYTDFIHCVREGWLAGR